MGQTRQTRLLAALLATTVIAIAGTVIAPSAARAQTAAEQSHDFAIGRKPVRQTLNEIARTAGLSVVYQENPAASQLANPVQGRLTVSAAISAALAGTGLQWHQTDARTITIAAPAPLASQAAAPGDSIVLDQVTLSAAPGTTTEGTGSWTTEWMRSSTGLMLSQKETPQSTSAITDAQMRSGNITTIKGAMDDATGISAFVHESDYVSYYSRGFEIDAYQMDSVPIPRDATWSYGDGNPDMALYDHVEFVRGATGLMQGTGEPGGSVNFIRKRPTEDFQSSAAIGLASPKGARLESDVSGPLNEAGTIRGRLVSVVDDRDGSLDRYRKRKYVLFGAIEADLTDNTVLNAGLIYQKTKTRGATWSGLLPAYSDGGLIDWPRGTSFGTDWTQVDSKRREAFLSLEHAFTNGWTGRLSFTHVRNDFDARYLWLTGTPDRETGLGVAASSITRYAGRNELNSVNGQIEGAFDLAGQSHDFVLGASASRGSSSQPTYYVDAPVVEIGNIFDFDGNIPEPVWPEEPSRIRDAVAKQYALYGTLRYRLSDRLAVLGGARLNWWKGGETDRGVELAYDYNGIAIPYLGVTYDLNDDFTAYGSVTGIYKPQLLQDRNRNYLDPAYGWNYELGVKGGLMDGALQTSVAVFETRQKDVANYVDWIPEEGRSVYELIDGISTRGFEIEAAGAISDRWNVAMGYTWRYSKDRDGNEVNAQMPRHTLKLATNYRIAGLFDDRLTVGGAMRWQSATTSEPWYTDSVIIRQGSYTVYDLSAVYEVNDRIDLTMSVNNLFNKKYYASTGSFDRVVYGDDRSAELILRARF